MSAPHTQRIGIAGRSCTITQMPHHLVTVDWEDDWCP